MNLKLLATALMVVSVSACEQANRLEEALTGKPALVPVEPVALVDTPDTFPVHPLGDKPVPVVAPPVVEPEPAPLQWGDAGYVCEPVFRVLSCSDDGAPHALDSNGNWTD
jgi:hypothetical protein